MKITISHPIPYSVEDCVQFRLLAAAHEIAGGSGKAVWDLDLEKGWTATFSGLDIASSHEVGGNFNSVFRISYGFENSDFQSNW